MLLKSGLLCERTHKKANTQQLRVRNQVRVGSASASGGQLTGIETETETALIGIARGTASARVTGIGELCPASTC